MSIRLRVAAVFALALAAAFTLGGWLFLGQLSAAMLRATDAGLAGQVAQASRYLGDEGNPTAPIVAGHPAPGEPVLQVIDSSGRVRKASADAGRVPILPVADVHRASRSMIALTLTVDQQAERLLAGPLPDHPGWVAVAGVRLADSQATLREVTWGLVIGGAFFALAGGAGAYWLARAALAPVERLRREAAALAERDTGAPLPVPGTRDEIAALAGTMNDLLARLRSSLARQRAFVADASHELRTPFAVLRGELELASRPGRGEEELRAAVASAAAEAERLTRITNDLLLLARGDEEQLTLERETADIAALLARSADRASARAGTVACEVAAPSGLTALVDAGRVRQAVDNLLDNALRYAPPGSVVGLSARAVDSALVIEVRDSGPGFPPEFLPHAFERFRRPGGERSRGTGGAGLGLAIVAAIAAAHGGQVSAANSPGGGALVRLELPGAV